VESTHISKYLQWSQVNSRVEQILNLYVTDNTAKLTSPVRNQCTVKHKYIDFSVCPDFTD